MNDALYVGSTGLAVQQVRMETVANNLANMNTPAFKRSRALFVDQMYRHLPAASTTQDEERWAAHIGLGARVASVDKVFTQGELRATDSPLDLAINGDGLISVQNTDGSVAFSRGGSLRINEDGFLALGNGMPLDPPIAIPHDAQGLSIDQAGRVMVGMDDDQPQEIGRIDLALFSSPGGLKPLGENLYAATADSGEALFERPGEGGRGVLMQRHVEGSNVKMADELVSLMLALRAFEANAKIIQAADEILAMGNNLRRA